MPPRLFEMDEGIGNLETSGRAAMLLYTSLRSEAEEELERADLKKVNQINKTNFIVETSK